MKTTAQRPLLAKSVRSGRAPLTLEQHLVDTEQAASRLFREDSRWGTAWCRFFRLPAAEHPKLLLHLRVASLFHDIGKANEEFLDAVGGLGAGQTLRHEHLSALVLSLPAVREWLSTNAALDVDVVVAAVLSHHMKAADSGEWKWCQARGRQSLALRLGDTQVIEILKRVREVAGLATPAPVLPSDVWSGESVVWNEAFAHGSRAARAFRRALVRDDARRALLLATKAGLVVADSVASGLVREGHGINEWIDDVAHAEALSAEQIDRAILDPRVRDIEARQGKPFVFLSFQTRAEDIGPRALLLAACGAGKTLAAWRWAREQARVRPLGRVIFLYPTRGTATEGFRDYVSWAPEAEAALVHGAARYELDAMRSNPLEGREDRNFVRSEADERLFALGLWSRRYFSATVDQFLSFLEHSYSSTCLLPALADSAVIIDEVHSFDRRMFDDLIAFLKAFDVPVLCMTATLTAGLRRQLEGTGLRVYPNEVEAREFADLDRLERHPRYALERVAGEDEAFSRAVEAFRAGERVLWVVNVVARAQALADRLEAELGTVVGCYHSRYTLADRQRTHRATVDAFRDPYKAVIAVTTQVCEMSLDLDADMLVTEEAPISSLVQRFGRSNRHLARGMQFRSRLVVYRPENGRPYDREALAPVDAFLAAITRSDLSQRELAEALEQHSPPVVTADGNARFLEGGYFATTGNFRDADEFTQPCVLERDLDDVKECLARKEPIDGFVVGVPQRFALPRDEALHAWLPRYLHVAEAANYQPSRGFVSPGVKE